MPVTVTVVPATASFNVTVGAVGGVGAVGAVAGDPW
jgi:hypothetical protein